MALVLAQKSTFDGWEIYGQLLKFPNPCHIFYFIYGVAQAQGEQIYIMQKADMK